MLCERDGRRCQMKWYMSHVYDCCWVLVVREKRGAVKEKTGFRIQIQSSLWRVLKGVQQYRKSRICAQCWRGIRGEDVVHWYTCQFQESDEWWRRRRNDSMWLHWLITLHRQWRTQVLHSMYYIESHGKFRGLCANCVGRRFCEKHFQLCVTWICSNHCYLWSKWWSLHWSQMVYGTWRVDILSSEDVSNCNPPYVCNDN